VENLVKISQVPVVEPVAGSVCDPETAAEVSEPVDTGSVEPENLTYHS